MSLNAQETHLRELHDEVRALKESFRALQSAVGTKGARIQEIESRNRILEQENKNLQEQLDYLKKKLFGRSSEKKVVETPGQMNLSDFFDDVAVFNEAEASPEPSRDQLADEEDARTHKEPKNRKKKTSMIAKFAGLPVREVLLDLPDDRKTCSKCGALLKPLGEPVFVRREFNFIPARADICM